MADGQALLQEGTVSLTKPVLGLAVGGTLGKMALIEWRFGTDR